MLTAADFNALWLAYAADQLPVLRKEISDREMQKKNKRLTSYKAPPAKHMKRAPKPRRKPPTTFPHFPLLPFELRAMIYHLSLPTHPRLIRLNMGQYRCAYEYHPRPGTPPSFTIIPKFHSESKHHDTRAYCRLLPALLSVNTEARNEALRVYKPFGATFIRPDLDAVLVRFCSSSKLEIVSTQYFLNRSGDKRRRKVYRAAEEPVVDP